MISQFLLAALAVFFSDTHPREIGFIPFCKRMAGCRFILVVVDEVLHFVHFGRRLFFVLFLGCICRILAVFLS